MQQAEELRKRLKEYPEASKWKNSYLSGILSVPNRAFEYSVQKVINAIHWRREMQVESIHQRHLSQVLEAGSLYWHGYSKQMHPILWVRPSKKDWDHFDCKEELRMHVLMVEAGINNMMPPNIDTFLVVADSNGLGFQQMNVPFLRDLGKIMTIGYPDRLEKLYVGPVNFLVRAVYSIMKAFLPNRIFSKIQLMGNDLQTELKKELYPQDLPDFMGGFAIHEQHVFEDGQFCWQKMISYQQQRLHALQSG